MYFLIGIDVDTYQGYEHLPADLQRHIGVSILDTRVLHHSIHECVNLTRDTDTLESYKFVVGDSKYCKPASRKFLFGKSQLVPLSEVKAQVEPLVCCRSRANIIVFHSDYSDRKALPLYIIDNIKAA